MTYLILILALGVNFVLAMAELALVSSRKVRLSQLADKGSRGAKAALELAETPTRFLSVAQAGITLVAIFSGAYGEHSLAEELKDWLLEQTPLKGHPSGAEVAAFAIVTLSIGYVSLVFGELVPKRIGMNHPEPIACLVAMPMKWLMRAMAPIVALLSFSTDIILRLLRSRPQSAGAVTPEEIQGLIEMGTEEGIFEESAQKLVERVFKLSNQSVSSLMVPRTEISWIRLGDRKEKVGELLRTSGRSHYPVYEGDLEHPVGVVHVKDVARALLSGTYDLRKVMRPPLFVPESMPALRVLEEFKKAKAHIAFILDEYGGLAGLITLNDIVAGVLGQIQRQGEDRDEPTEIVRADGSLLLDGLLPVERVREITGLERLPREDAAYKTLGGMMVTNLGRIPRSADVFEHQGHRFEVVDMDGRRVDKVMYFKRPERKVEPAEHAE